MSLLSKITEAFFPSNASPSVRTGTRTYIVDPAPVDEEKGRRERMAPGAQVKFLQRVSRFAEKESLKFTAVLGGKELRAVKDGDDFQGIRVFFAEQASAVSGVVKNQLRAQLKGGPVTVITDDAALEGEAVSAGADPMRLSTFLKAFDGGGGRDGGGKSSRNRSRSRTRDRGGDRNSDRKRNRNDDQPRMSRQGGSDTVAVRDLLDLVD